MEIWKYIKGYEGIYQASSYGRIKGVEGRITYSDRHGKRIWKERILKYRGYTPKTGYRVSLWKNKKTHDFLVARLVAFTFYDVDINNHKLTVNHIDGNRMNNHIDNLELVSYRQNQIHAHKNGLTYQRRIIIKNIKTDEEYNFISHADCERFLKKRHNYLNGKIKRNNMILENDKGDQFQIIKLYPLRKEHKGTI